MKGLPNSADLRKLLHQVRDFSEVEEIFSNYLLHYEEYRAQRLAASDPDVSDLTCEVA